VLSFAAVLLWRWSGQHAQLNDDGLPGFSAEDRLAPVLTCVAASADLRAGRRHLEDVGWPSPRRPFHPPGGMAAALPPATLTATAGSFGVFGRRFGEGPRGVL
jgi:hypothetical protein